jgi:hypothetical protein
MISEDNHKVSIIVVNWNGERFLKDGLDGFLTKIKRMEMGRAQISSYQLSFEQWHFSYLFLNPTL